ncbi:hypothetical protein BBOV_II007490 [Babesia bovis T2Bo]|uniref:Uncharacterized protein n=1 Tax=Babesia bovis TaxID=5865 RepID=A7AUT8_BABBO|nr:hypothetical protein BBOV_II007490 [Babesia bovis T2Bo]EDO06699.1 hypothetical protein BBOV_II007490 [Babesia bovis T2Bo]|eukprot:XP_001610267.1 hypothetical protein [Babesia bovis T2Bo]
MAPWRFVQCRQFSSSDLEQKAQEVFKLIKIDPQTLRNNRDVVIYTRNRVCPDCGKTITAQKPEFAEYACPAAWRYHHGFSQKCPCPLIGFTRFVRFDALRLALRASLDAAAKDIESVKTE